MLHDITQWFGDLFKGAFVAIFLLLQDIAVSVFTAFLDAMGTLLAAIPVPDFMSGGLSAFWVNLPGGILYILTATGAPQALAIIGAGFAFRLTRKLFTLFQW